MKFSRSLRPARRQFLRGAGGFTLGLPFLPSLLPGPAYGQDPQPVRQKRFVFFRNDHGGVARDNWVPPDATLTRSQSYGGHTIRAADLTGTTQGARTVLSPVFSAASANLPPKLIAKLNILYGFTAQSGIGHNVGTLGNFRQDPEGDAVPEDRITIDQVMAYSSSFYRSTTGVRSRAIVGGAGGGRLSWGYSNPTAGSGTIQATDTAGDDNRGLWNSVLGGVQMTQPTGAVRPTIVSRVLANYQRLRNGNPRLSREDRQRLDDHIGRISELDQRLGQPPVSCTPFHRPGNQTEIWVGGGTDFDTLAAHYQYTNDVIVSAFICGTTAIAVRGLSPLSDYGGNWHQDIAHQHDTASAQARLVESNQRLFERVFLDLARKLDVPEAGDRTYLDNSLLAWGQESGTVTHNHNGAVVVTAGSAGGHYKTGQFVDYRNPAASARDSGEQTGLSHRQWLGSVLQSMGVPKSEYERPGEPGGYGYPSVEARYAKTMAAGVLSAQGEPLPFVTA